MANESDTPARPKPRIESLSDMIFGLALSVGAITLVGNPPSTASELLADIAAFAFSFMILINVWMHYTKIMSALPLENRWTISLNSLLLFVVSIEPFLFNLLIHTSSSSPSDFENVLSIAYACDLGALNLVLGFFTRALADEQKKLIPADLLKEFRNQAYVFYFIGALFVASSFVPLSIPGFFLPLRFDFWFVPFLISGVRRRTNDVKDLQKALSKNKNQTV
jgi:uncharacterized membrane protein